MTGFGSPCGACKFLRRKCARGCVFAPYFCDEQGATRFAAIHKVFGASNFSKLLIQLPLTDHHRSQAAATISYQAQARIQDPIYGCVSHIFALQQQVVSLQAQLLSLKAQAAAAEAPPPLSFTSGSSSPQEEVINNNFPPYRQDWHASLFPNNHSSLFDPTMISGEQSATYYHHQPSHHRSYENNVISTEEENIFGSDSSSSCEMMRFPFSDTEDLQSIPFAYLQHI